MKHTVLISAAALVLISGAVLADTAPPKAMSFGEQVADWFGNVATRVRALEQQHAGTRLEDLQKRVTALETEVTQLKSQSAQAASDAQKTQERLDEMEANKKGSANRHSAQR